MGDTLEVVTSGGIISLTLLFLMREWPTIKGFFKSGNLNQATGKDPLEVSKLVGERVAEILSLHFLQAQERNRKELVEQVNRLEKAIERQNDIFNRFRSDFDRHCGYTENSRNTHNRS